MSSVPSPTDPIADPEGMLRRIPVKVWSAQQSDFPPAKAFFPQKPIPRSGHPGDVDGLSVSREAITPASRLSVAPGGKSYHVVRLAAGIIRLAEVSIKPDPQEHDAGHCLLPEINIVDYQNSPERKTWIKERAAKFAQGCTIAVRIE